MLFMSTFLRFFYNIGLICDLLVFCFYSFSGKETFNMTKARLLKTNDVVS